MADYRNSLTLVAQLANATDSLSGVVGQERKAVPLDQGLFNPLLEPKIASHFARKIHEILLGHDFISLRHIIKPSNG